MSDDTVPVSIGFDALYRQEYPALIAVATALTGTLEDGEDAVLGAAELDRARDIGHGEGRD